CRSCDEHRRNGRLHGEGRGRPPPRLDRRTQRISRALRDSWPTVLFAAAALRADWPTVLLRPPPFGRTGRRSCCGRRPSGGLADGLVAAAALRADWPTVLFAAAALRADWPTVLLRPPPFGRTGRR